MSELKFEEALKKLEGIVSEMESGELSLENALKKYEEGIKLSRFCSKKLKEAEKKVEILVREEGGDLSAKPFDPAHISEGDNSIAKKGETAKPSDADEDLLF